MPKPPPTSGVTTRKWLFGSLKTTSASRFCTSQDPWVLVVSVQCAFAGSYSATAARASMLATTTRLFTTVRRVTWAALANSASVFCRSPACQSKQVLFGALGLAAIFAYRAYARRNPATSTQPNLNQRGAQPTSLTMYAATQFPYATAAERDPVTRRVDGLFEHGRAAKTQPKVMFTNTAVEYWGGGRAAALIHTTADGKRDLALPPNVRAYFLTGAQHGPAPFPAPAETAGQQPSNPLEYWWTMRALLVAMTDWVTRGVEPPASQVPRLSDGSLVTVAKLKFPALPGVANPRTVQGPRAENHDLPFLVPQVDADGNEIAGIRTPEHRVPMATFTGWNFRGAAIGGTAQLVNLLGAAVPFPATKTAGDPRRALDERYPAKDAYLAAASEAADALVKGRYLRRDDVAAVMARVEAWWAQVHPAGSR